MSVGLGSSIPTRCSTCRASWVNVDYFPTFPEVAVSIGIFSAGIMAFGLLAKYFPVFEAERITKHTRRIENV